MYTINITLSNGSKRTEKAYTEDFAIARAKALNNMQNVTETEVRDKNYGLVWF